MADIVKYVYGTEVQIMSLTALSPLWFEKGFYYPSDKSYFYQLVEGVMRKYGDGVNPVTVGEGILLNDAPIFGVKINILEQDALWIPINYDYNTHTLNIQGIVTCEGQININ